MILTRAGNKRKLAAEIIQYFPSHTTYIELFFGGGGVFFNKPLAKYNFCNDLDDDVVNLYDVITHQKEAFIAALEVMPIHETLFKRWKDTPEIDPITKAVRFVFLANFSYLGKMDTLRLGGNPKKMIVDRVDATQKKAKDVFFTCCDFREVFPKIPFRDDLQRREVFVYADSPYLDACMKTYNTPKWKENDAIDLFEMLVNSGFKFAISEFDNPFILDLVKSYDLKIAFRGERLNLKNRRNEILIINYQTQDLFR